MLNTTVGAMFQAAAARFPQRPCVETAEAVVSYAQADRYTDRVAAALSARGLTKGSRAGVWCKDTPEFLYLYLALEKLGCVPVLLNTSLTGAELQVLLDKTETPLLFYDEGYKGVRFDREAAALKSVTAVSISAFLSALPDEDGLDHQALAARYAAVTPRDPDVIIFTSGTSGTAKGVLSTHYARVNVAQAQVDTIAMTQRDKLCVAIPLYHCFGLTGVALAALNCGACLYFPPERRTRLLLEAVSVHKCTVLSAVPTLFSAIIARSDLGDYDLGSLRTGYIGGSVYTPEFFLRVEAALGVSLAPSLGQTEATAGLTFLSPEEPAALRAATVGRFLSTIEGQIRHIRDGHVLPRGETGEICIRGWSVMTEYVNEPELTREAIDGEGWLHTGDLGWLDGQDCLHMAGRLKELIIRGGENIAPGEIEAVISADPRVREVKAVAVPDAHYGEEICACVVCRGGEVLDEAAVQALAAAALAEYKVPRYVLFFDALPSTGSGKLALAALKTQAARRLGLA